MLKSYLYNNLVEAGCDEAGRGSLAGPVFAAAVILPKKFQHPVLNDSKKLSAAQRSELRDEIIEKLQSKYQQEAFQHWLDKMMSEYFIGVYI